MLLLVNIGNSNIRFGIFKTEDEVTSWTINTRPYRTEDECFAKFQGMYGPFGVHKEDITDIVIASVVPPMTQAVKNALKRIHNGVIPMVVDRHTPSPVQHESQTMGTDIYANAVAANQLYKEGKKVVVDFGTALTFVSVDENGISGGAAIAPGVNTALKSLVGETAQLPEIELIKPERVLAFTTEACMQSGLVLGYLSLVEGMLDRIEEEMGEKPYVIATGGLSGVFAPMTSRIDKQDIYHTLKGIRLLYELNKGQ